MMDVNDYAFIGQAVLLICAAFGAAVMMFCCIKCGKDIEGIIRGKGGQTNGEN